MAYAEENARRHHRTGRDRADAVGADPEVSLRYIIGFVYPISAPMRPFLTREGDDEGTVAAMHQAWFKAVTMQVALWARPFAGDAWSPCV